MASGLKGNEIVQSVLKRNLLSSPVKDGDNNTNDAALRPKNVETEAENSFSPSLLVPLKSRTSLNETVSVPPLASAPFGPTILDKLITKNKLQSMKEAELRKDKTNENASSTQETKPVDPQVLKKRKMIANRLRNPFVTKRRKRFKRKQNEATNQDVSKQKNRLAGSSRVGGNVGSPNAKKRTINLKETKTDSRIAENRSRRRLNSDSSASTPTKKTILNKSNRPLKSKMSNVEALKQSSKLGRNNRYSTRSDSPVLRNGKRRKCDEITFDLYDIDKKRKRLTNDLASVKSDGMSDEQCSYVTASESDICSFLDLETSSQNLDVKEESCDSTFKLEVPTSPSIDGDDVNSNLINLETPFKGIASSPGKTVKKERYSIEEEIKTSDTLESKFDLDIKVEDSSVQEDLKDEKLSCEIEKEEDICGSTEAKQEELETLGLKEDEELDEEYLLNSTSEEKEIVSTGLDSSNETILLEDSSVSENSITVLTDSGEKEADISIIPQTSMQEVSQARKFRSASLNDGCKVGKVSFSKFAARKFDQDQHKASDSDEPSFTADNSQFELFVEREFKRGRKKRSSSDTSLQRLQNASSESGKKLKSVCPIPEDEKSSDANGPFSDEKENEFYEKYITEESNSEEASCSSSQVSEHPKLTDKEFSALHDLECKSDKDLKENEQQQANENKEDQVMSSLPSGDGEKPTSDTPEAQAMKESILSALGLQSATMQATQKVKPKDKYTGTLKAVIKLNRTADRKSTAGRMVFKQKDTSNVGSKNLEYRICSELAPGSENVPLTHLKDIAVNNISKKSQLKPKSHFDLSGPLNEVDVEVAQVKKQEEAAGDGSAPKEEEVKKALVIPEKSSSFSIHPERLCSDVCSYCHGKFGSLDTPCHIGQIKNSERRSKILSIEILLTKDSCLCDACFRYVDRRANCPSFKAQAPKPQKRQPLSDAVCSVQGCGQPANHSVRRKWIVKLKKSIAKKLMIDMEKIQHNQHLPFPLCSQHYYWVDYFTVCGICKKRLSRNNMYALGPEAEELNQFLHEDGIPVHLTDKLFLCKLCRYYSSLRLKYKDLSMMTPGHKTYFRSYRRKILQYHDIEVSESEEDAGSKSAEDESAENHSQGKVKRRKSKKNVSEESKKSGSDEKLKQNPACVQGYTYVDPLEGHQNDAVTPTIDYSALGETGEVGFNNIASLLGGRDQSENSGNQARIQVKFGNLNIGKLANLNIGQDARTNSDRVQRPPYLPGEQELPLKADISFQSGSKSSAWERCVSTIQFDKDTKQLWQELQRPYGNSSSFMRHLVMLEKHWRSGSLVLVDNADPRAVKYVNSVRNRVDSFERNFKTPSLLTSSSSKSPSPAPRSNTPVPVSVPKAPETPVAPSASKPSDSSDKCDKLENKSDTPQVPPVSSTAVSSVVFPSTALPSTSTALPSTSTVLPSTTFPRTALPSSAFPSTALPSTVFPSTVLPSTTFTSTTFPSTTFPNTAFPSTTLPSSSITLPSNAFPNNAFPNTIISSTVLSEPLCSVTKTSMTGASTTASVNSNIVTSPLVQCLNTPSSIPVVNLVNLNSSISNSSVSVSRSSSSPNVSYASLASAPLPSSPSVSLILPPNLSTSLPSSLQNTLINFTSDRSNISLNQFSTPNISISPSPSLKSSPHVSIAPKPNPARQPPLKSPGAISRLLTGNKSAVSSPSSINNNLQFRKNIPHTPIDPALFNKVRKPNSNQVQRQTPKLPPQLLRFPGPAKAKVPPLELIVPNSFTMQTKTIPVSSPQPISNRPRTPSATQGIMDNLAMLRQFRSLKPKPDPKPSASASFSPMICDVRSLASSEVDKTKMGPASGSMPKIPKALTITQVSQPAAFPRSVTVSLEKKPNQIPAAFLGGEKPSVSVFCEVNPPP